MGEPAPCQLTNHERTVLRKAAAAGLITDDQAALLRATDTLTNEQMDVRQQVVAHLGRVLAQGSRRPNAFKILELRRQKVQPERLRAIGKARRIMEARGRSGWDKYIGYDAQWVAGVWHKRSTGANRVQEQRSRSLPGRPIGHEGPQRDSHEIGPDRAADGVLPVRLVGLGERPRRPDRRLAGSCP